MKRKENKKIKSFTDLNVWKEGRQFVVLIYKTTKEFPREETYSLVDQMRRAATSITSNIAEGFGRQTYREKVQFYYQAQGSLTELKNQILIARDVGYLGSENMIILVHQANTVHKLLQGLIQKTKSFVNPKS